MSGCPFHDGGDDDDGDGSSHQWGGGRAIGRRALLTSAVAIGGVRALRTALGAEGGDADPASMPYPTGDPSARPRQQHRWSPAGRPDEFGNPTAPRHQLVLLLEYVGENVNRDRQTVEQALRQLEEAFAYDQTEGLLFTVGYSPAYFDRHWNREPKAVDIVEPRSVSPHNDPTLDRQDAVLHLASDEAGIVLAAESALLGDVETVNGVSVEATFEGVFETDERRSVFVGVDDDGDGLPAQRVDNEHIDEGAPLSMGFDSLYTDGIPPEEKVTIGSGPWRDGTVAMVSKLRLDLDEWYERDRADRVGKMFAPQYAEADVGDFGEGLGAGSGRGDGDGWDEALTDRTTDDAREKGVVGHAQKVTRARDDDFEVDLLRRDGNLTIDGGDGGLSFVGLVAGISDWFDMAERMYDTDLDDLLRDGEAGDGHHPKSGIAAHVEALNRGHFLLPPRPLRALPPA